MENRSLSVVAGLIAGFLLSAAVAAAANESGPSEEQQADWTRRMDHAKALQRQAEAQKSEATAAFEARKKECFRKFRVNACQDEAKQEYVKITAEARRMDNEGKALERQIKKEQLADKDARRIEEAPQKEADLKAREARTQVEREQGEAARAGKLEKKERQLEEGAAKAAANEERLRKKREQHERNVAEKLEKAKRREAETAQ